MADYKSILKGTLNAVGTKAKNFVESGALKESYDRGTTTARCYATVAKLNLQINGELEEQKKTFIEIGRLYFDEHRDCAEGKYATLFRELEESDRKIEQMRTELEAVKATLEASKSYSADPNIVYYIEDKDNE